MFNVVEKNQKVVKGILIAVTATFVVWGMGNYLNMSSDGFVAKVGSVKIYSQDVDRAVAQQQDANPKATINRQDVLFGLVNRQLLLNSIKDQGMSVDVSQLQDYILQIPAFQTNDKFDVNKYKEFLQSRSITADQFQQQLSEQLLLNQVVDFYNSSYFTPESFDAKFSQLLSKERTVYAHVFNLEDYMSKVNVTESQAMAVYQANQAQFVSPASYKLQYITLSANDLLGSIAVSDQEINSYISTHPATAQNEQVDVSHILFAVPQDADQKTIDAIQAKAQKVLASARANPDNFAKLATAYSQDPGSAKNGGELGYITKGTMVKQFEDAAFSMKVGQISGLVRTQYGFHILKLNATKGNDEVSLKADAVTQLKKQKAAQAMQLEVAKIGDIAYNQPNSLDAVAKSAGVAVISSDWIAANSKEGLLANPKIVAALAKDDVIKNRHNSEVIDMGDGSYIVIRVADYKAQSILAFADVKANIMQQLKNQEAAKLSAQAGANALQQLQSGKSVDLSYGSVMKLNLLSSSTDASQQAIKQIFGVKLDMAPAYTGVINDHGEYVVYKITGETLDSDLIAQNQKILSQLQAQYAMLGLNTNLLYLKDKYTIKINNPMTVQTQQQQ